MGDELIDTDVMLIAEELEKRNIPFKTVRKHNQEKHPYEIVYMESVTDELKAKVESS